MEVGLDTNRVIRFGVFEMDLDDLILYRRGIDTRLANQPARLLGLLIKRPNQVLTREEIRQSLWPGESQGEFDGRLNHAITCIRRALHEDPANPVYIQTVPRNGYRFIGPIEGAAPKELDRPNFKLSEGSTQDHEADAVSRRPIRQSLKPFLMPAAVAGAAVLAFVYIWSFSVWQSTKSPMHQHQAGDNVPGTSLPVIISVSAIQTTQTQEIVIDGRGFGHFTPFTSLDTPFLAIADETGHWVAGRIQPNNADAVTVTISAWTDAHIVVEGFSGQYGLHGWKLNPGDKIRVDVWNPQTGAGPANHFVYVNK